MNKNINAAEENSENPSTWCKIVDGRILVNSTRTGEFFGVTRKTLIAWHLRGAPQVQRGWWDIQALMGWRYGGQSIEQSSEARKAQADAAFREIKAKKEQIALDILEGRLIEREAVDKQWTVIGTQIKNNLLMWVKSLSPMLANQDIRSVESVLKSSVYDLLEQLSSKGKYKPTRKK